MSEQLRPLLDALRKDDMEKAWAVMQYLLRSLAPEERSSIMRGSQIVGPMRKMTSIAQVAYIARVFGPQAEGQTSYERMELPAPADLLKCALLMGAATNQIVSAVIPRFCRRVLAIQAEANEAMFAQQSHEVMEQISRLWHAVLSGSLSLQRARSIPGDSAVNTDWSNMSWAFLPPLENVVSDERAMRVHLADVLASILPVMPDGRQVDYQEGFLLTLQLLRDHQSSADPEQSANYKPLLAFFEGIYSHVPKPTISSRFLHRLDRSADPHLAAYETLFSKLELRDLPPRRLDRDRVNMPPAPASREPDINNNMAALDKTINTVPTPNADLVEIEDENADVAPAMKLDALRDAGFSVLDAYSMSPDVHMKVDTWTKRLGRAIESANLAQVQLCWKEVQAFNAENVGTSSLPLYLYEHFMQAFVSMRQPALAIQTWNAVVAADLQPTVRTWTVMMRGCGRANDADMLEQFWNRMRGQGIQPDQHAWSVRLFGLIKANRIREALTALADMGNEWITAVQAVQPKEQSPIKRRTANASPVDIAKYPDDVNGVARPNLVIMNSVISALAGKDDSKIPQALAWGKSFGLEPDTTSFNALLNVAMRHGQFAEGLAILERMQARNISPDSTTYTVILTAIFQSGFFNNLSRADQTAKLSGLITQIESSFNNARLDIKAYALAIDSMLKHHSNADAARMLLEHMASHGLQPSTHIYTILMSFYFSRSPPDFAAVDALWQRIKRANAGHGAPVDGIFYDRMIEAYAKHHRTLGIASSMHFLERMGKEGKRPGWRALESIARALADREEWARLGVLVSDLRSNKGLLRYGARGVMGQNEFWEFVIGTGVLSGEGVRSARDVRISTGTSSWRKAVEAV
nr:hypothetical protein B0A51_12073 [Rachicladosporium sp. CCFEE 5018]